MNELTTVIKGNLTSDPERRKTGAKAQVHFGVAHKPRRWDRETEGFVDSEPIFMRCIAHGAQGEHLYESMRRGDRVIAEVQLTQRTFTKDGREQTVIEGTVIEIGASLLFHEVDIDQDTESGGGSHTGAPGAP